jgi:hypothetical protein
MFNFFFNEQPDRDSNLRPSEYRTAVLLTELSGRLQTTSPDNRTVRCHDIIIFGTIWDSTYHNFGSPEDFFSTSFYPFLLLCLPFSRNCSGISWIAPIIRRQFGYMLLVIVGGFRNLYKIFTLKHVLSFASRLKVYEFKK